VGIVGIFTGGAGLVLLVPLSAVDALVEGGLEEFLMKWPRTEDPGYNPLRNG
jgi:hypothetical protein